MFYNCTQLTVVPEMDTSNVNDFASMFNYCQKLTTLSEMNTSNATSANGMFSGCISLTNLGGFVGLKISLDLSHCSKLTHESLLNVINKVSDVTASPATLTLGATNIAKLSDAEKAIATSKGWTLA